MCLFLELIRYPLNFDDNIHFNSVKSLKMRCNNLRPPIPLTFDALETFENASLSLSPLPSSVFDFVRNNPTIDKLSVSSFSAKNDIFSDKKMNQMKESFASVKEIELICVNVFTSTEEITCFLDHCESLQRLTLKAVSEDGFCRLIELTKSLESFTIDKKEKIIIWQKSMGNN